MNAGRFLRKFPSQSRFISSSFQFQCNRKWASGGPTLEGIGAPPLEVPCSARPDTNRLQSELLLHRGIVSVSGPDAAVFLQGLITNDINHLQLLENTTSSKVESNLTTSIYALMLNHQGRVLYDAIIYLVSENDEKSVSYLIECDSRITTDLCKHLHMFKIRKKVDILDSSDRFQIWNFFVPCISSEHESPFTESHFSKQLKSLKFDGLVASTKDPRLSSLGLRLVVTTGTEPTNVDLFDNVNSATPIIDSDYTIRRYRYGIGEGITDLPLGNCFPLECNADYLHGVSFHKGCYIGQELTARTHHTGVVRKRLLPLMFDCPLESVSRESQELLVKNERGKTVGRIRGHRKRFGLGLMRIQECLQQPQKLFVEGTNGDIEVKVHKPSWWPFEAPKENLAASKN